MAWPLASHDRLEMWLGFRGIVCVCPCVIIRYKSCMLAGRVKNRATFPRRFYAYPLYLFVWSVDLGIYRACWNEV